MWTIAFWKLKGCRETNDASAFGELTFDTREQAINHLTKKLDHALDDAEKRVNNAKKWIAKAKAFGLYKEKQVAA